VEATTTRDGCGCRRAWRWPAGLAWALWLLATVVLGVNWLQDRLLGQAGRPDLAPLSAAIVAPVLASVSAATVGAVLAARAASRYAVLYLPATVVAALTCLGFVLLLSPTGSLPSRRWRWWAWATAAAPVACLLAITLAPRPFDRPYQAAENPLDVSGLTGPLLVIYQLAFAVTNLAVLVGAASLVVRFRRASGTERQQLRWVALAAALALLGSVVVLALSLLDASPVLLGWVAGCYFAILPLAIGAAILRYRLYDLDRIISRTLAYGLLSVLLGLGYATVVLGLGRLLPQRSSLAVAAATLAAAAAFGHRLRDQVDLDTLTGELLAVVHQTMQPTQASLWLRPQGPPEPERARSLSR
jgi:hypothetical protein